MPSLPDHWHRDLTDAVSPYLHIARVDVVVTPKPAEPGDEVRVVIGGFVRLVAVDPRRAVDPSARRALALTWYEAAVVAVEILGWRHHAYPALGLGGRVDRKPSGARRLVLEATVELDLLPPVPGGRHEVMEVTDMGED